MKKPTIGIRIEGVVVKVWNGMQDIDKNSEYKRTKVSTAIKLNRTYRGFIWERHDK